MADPLPTKGQKQISISEWKRFQRVADWWDRTHGHKPPTANAPFGGRDPLVIVVQNVSGVAKRKYEVCQIRRTKTLTDFVSDKTFATAEDPWQGGITPGGTINYLPKQVGVYLDTAPINAYARVQIAGACPALVYLNANSDNYCDVDYQEDRLISTVAGSIQIVQKPATVTGEQLCMVNLSRQEECHLIGIPQGAGITAYAGGVPGTGVVRLYFQKDGTIYDVVENSAPAYLTVYSLHDDPIVANAAHSYDGAGYTPGYSTEEYCLLHRDMYGTWWIDPMPHTKVGVLYLAGASATFSPPTVDYMEQTGITNLDAAILTAYSSGDVENGVCRVNLKGDYTITLTWYGGEYSSDDAPTITGYGHLAFAPIIVTVQYLEPGGAWTNLLYSPVVRALWDNYSGGSATTSINLDAGTLLRARVSLGTQFTSGTADFSQGGLTATVNVIKHA